MSKRNFKIVRAGLALVAAAVTAAAAPAAEAVSVDAAVASVAVDDHASFAPGVIAQARRAFLDALASEKSDAATLSRMLPRHAEPVAALIGAAPAGAARAEALLQRLGLDPQRFLAARDTGLRDGSVRQSLGGPFISVTDPQVRAMADDAARRARLAASFARIPAFLPVAQPSQSSDFGYRRDPFHGGGAFHAGLDLTGKTGDSIHAAADGVVVRAGWWAGYGKVVVVDHGNGMETRYGHMSRFHVREGDVIRQGQVIGGMGSTGRSTGTHLHFEIRLDGRPLDPQPFLDLASFGLDAPIRTRATVIAPTNIANNEPYAPVLVPASAEDAVMAGGRTWTPRIGR
ncbi:M23 family metallopeptidase [Sandarakinorhabdus rubra]|uniref:M23 family metallopeptidase n=1 Tax=Sandarakinorhabdus rubra TaxID=2672568 RepID=UPI0013DC07F6|nr:M23 family metallopeptidase [Sandarakinorhabdus rubra]